MALMTRMTEHYEESLKYFKKDQIVGLFCQGSQNYNLDTPSSDLDTKLIVTPTFKEIALARKPVSTTHVRANEEHIDFKDIRLYCETFYKQNLNFLEILFTESYILNSLYAEQWTRLIEKRELIARMNPVRGIKSMYGIALEKYHALEHPYPSKIHLIEKYGYDAKQLSHLARVRIFLEHFLKDEPYEECLIPKEEEHAYIMTLKTNYFPLETARSLAETEKAEVEALYEPYKSMASEENSEARELLEDVSYNIMKIAVEKELNV